MTPQVDFAEQSYRESVETLARLQSSKVFSNGAPVHASIIFESFFRHAGRSVKIFCKNLAGEVFNSTWLIDGAKIALSRGVGISVIVQGTADQSAFLDWLKENKKHPGVSFQENASSSSAKVRNLACNFAVMDGRAYRYEADASVINAVACMNDSVLGGQLESIFSRLA